MAGSNPLEGLVYVTKCATLVENSPWYKEAQAYVHSVIHEIGTLDTFERIAVSLTKNTNPGRLIMIQLYAEELKKLLPDASSEINDIFLKCIQLGFMDMVRSS